MYQEDISGINAIDIAFEKNSIFCIKAFVDSLMQLTDDSQFRNCFDMAVLLMIIKGMDVKELVNSNLFYPPMWKKRSIFSEQQEPKIIAYDNDLEDLMYESPYNLFASKKSSFLDRFRCLCCKKKKDDTNTDIIAAPERISNQLEQHEMQFNYIFLEMIQGDNKIKLMKSLADSEDLCLFE